MAMLAYAPIAYGLLLGGHQALALLGFVGMLFVEPLPDNDFRIPGLRHRGISHSILCAVVIGGVIATFGWVVGEWLAVMLADTVAQSALATPLSHHVTFLRQLDGMALAGIGFAIGSFGIIVHLLGDAITVGGIRPFAPLSRRQISLTSLRADSSIANTLLFVLGAAAIGVAVIGGAQLYP